MREIARATAVLATSFGLFTLTQTQPVCAQSTCPANNQNATTASAVTSSQPQAIRLAAASMGMGTDSPPETATDDLSRLNNAFRASYADEKKAIRENLGPVIIMTGDEIALLKGQSRTAVKIIPAEYTLDKVVDHIALATFVALTGKTDKPLDTNTRHKLEELQALVSKAQPEVDGGGISASELARQHKIIDQSSAFIKETLQNGQVSAAALQGFTRGISKLTLANVDNAIGTSIAKINDVVQDWRKSMTASEWQQLRVVVVSGHMPRIQNSSMQYFQKLLRQKQEGDRVIYFEGSADDKQAIDLLVTHILDRKIAIAFYKDPWRMHRDLLSDGAHKYLKNHAPAGN